MLLVGLEPEDESPIVFLRLRKAFRKHRTAVYAVAPVATRGLAKVGGTLIPTAPGTEPEVLRALGEGSGTDVVAAAGQGLRDERRRPRRRAPRDGPGCAERRGRPRRGHRRPARLGAPPGR